MNDILKDWSNLLLIAFIHAFPYLVTCFFVVLFFSKIITVNELEYGYVNVVVKY